MKQPMIQVAARPANPLLVYDGECAFCRRWIARWQKTAAGRVDCVASQDARVAAQFPELPPERFAQSVQLIDTDGRVYDGAEAVFRALAKNPRWRWPLWFYEHLPGVAPVTEWGYRFLAARRRSFPGS